jgi:hypothetical protein
MKRFTDWKLMALKLTSRAESIIALGAAIFFALAVASAQAQMSTPGQFGVSPSGAATYSIPIQVPPGVAGMQPKLSLEYNSQGGNGLLGMGWNLSGLSAITRCPKTMATDGVRGVLTYEQSEDRFCLDGQRLMVTKGSYGAPGSEYRSEIDSFSKITAVGMAAGNTAIAGPASFKVQTKAGVVMWYGETQDALIEAVRASGYWYMNTPKAWMLNKVTDAVGNAMHFVYEEDRANGDVRIARINYGANAQPSTGAQSAEFVYQTRTDIVTAYDSGAFSSIVKRLSKIVTKNNGQTIHETQLEYSSDANPSKLIRVSQCQADGTCLRPLVFDWQLPQLAPENRVWLALNAGPGGVKVAAADQSNQYSADFNGDGRTDYMWWNNGWHVALSTGTEFTVSTAAWLSSNMMPSGVLPYGNVPANQYVADFNGDGRADFMWWSNNGWYVALSTGNGFTVSPAPWLNASMMPSGVTPYGNTSANQYVADFNGDGRADFMWWSNNGWYVALSTGNGFTVSPAPWLNASMMPSGVTPYGNTSANQYVADFNGDGRADFMWWSNGWYVALSKGNGFEPITQWLSANGGPYGAAANHPSNPRFQYIADVNGDGRADYIWFNSGWNVALSTGLGFATGVKWLDSVVPNTGIDTSPLLTSSTNDVFVADLNGDGRADLMWRVYAGNNHRWYVAYSSGSSFGLSHSTDLRANDLRINYLGDYDGDGIVDMMSLDNSAYGSGWWVSAKAAQLNLISKFSEGGPLYYERTNMTSVTYAPLSRSTSVYKKEASGTYPQIDLSLPLSVVSAHSKWVGANYSSSTSLFGNTVTYEYGGLKADNATASVPGSGRGMLGFRWMKSTEQSTGIESYTEYSQSWPFIGAPTKSETRHASATYGGLLKSASTTYTSTLGSANSTTFVYPASSTEQSWDFNGVQLPTISTQYAYSPSAYQGNTNNIQYGDPSRITVTTSLGGQEIGKKITVNEYKAADEANWQLGRLLRAQVTSSQAASAKPWPEGGMANTAQVNAANNPASAPAPLSVNQATGALAVIINFLLND